MSTKVDRIMAEAAEFKDPAVAVHLARIEGKMEGMKASNDALGKQLEAVVNELREVSKISQRYSVHDESVKRIWEEIEKRDRKWDERFEVLSDSHGTSKDKVNKIFYFAAGVGSIGTVLLSVILWIVIKEMGRTENNAQRIQAIELHLVADPVRPMKVK